MKRTPLEYFIRGSEIWRHRTQMYSIAVLWCLSFAAVVSLVVQFILAFVLFSQNERSIFYYNRVAAIESAVGLGGARILSREFSLDGVSPSRLQPAQIAYVTDRFYRDELQLRAIFIFLMTISAGVFAFRIAVRSKEKFGRDKSVDEFLRGAELVAPEEVAERVKAGGDVSRYTFAGLPIPTCAVVQNFLITGAVGKGKSQLFFDFMRQVSASKRKAIIWDLKGEFCEEFYRPGKDVILNIFDSRSPGWDLFSEIDRVTDFDQIAYSICPDSENETDNSKAFNGGARTIFSCLAKVFWEEGNHDTKALINFALTATDAELGEKLKGTTATPFINPKAPKATQAYRSTLSDAIKHLSYLPASGFSIRKWVLSDDDSWLFMTSDASVIDMIRPITSLWLDLAIRATASLPRTSEDRMWIFLDEVFALKHLPVLANSVTEMRAYGVVHVIGMQNVGQATKMFGRELSQVIRSCLQNFAVMAVSEEETAESYSKLLGAQETNEASDTTSFGAASSRDGDSIQRGRKEKRIVLPSELMRLPNLDMFVKIAGDFPVARLKFNYMYPKKNNPGFVYRQDLKVKAPGRGQPGLEADPETGEIVADDPYADLNF